MKWKKYTIYTTTEAEDIISAMLNELDVEGVQIEDNVPLTEEDTKGMFIDILPELPPDDGSSRVSFFLREQEEEAAFADCRHKAVKTGDSEDAGRKTEEAKNETVEDASCVSRDAEDRSYSIADRLWTKEEIRELLQNVKAELEDMRAYLNIGEGRIEESETEDIDWMNNWKQYFKPFLVEDFLIKPTWEAVPEEYKAGIADGSISLIEMDPGTAFGTGTHETTQLCMKMLKKYVKGGEHVLDVGTGSGILGIAALKLGAASIMATELDDVCMEAVGENCRLNGVSEEQFRLMIGNVIGDENITKAIGDKNYELVVANILAPVIVLLAGEGVIDRHIKKDGIFITSGIIDTREAEVTEAFQKNPNWEILEINHQGEWVNVTARRV